ncbi:MAG: hypothetical protein U9R51_01825 [Actinomycetota bacterium]|nr:hypothetical protein [Actinomycetota bacterium]
MSRLRRFEHNRFIGTRDDMVVHDCDNADDFAALEARSEKQDLMDEKLLQSFGPDTLTEARNRGFRSR